MDADETIAAAIAHIDAQVRAAEAKGYRAGLVDGEKKGLARAREIALVGDIWELPCTYPGCGRRPSGDCNHGNEEAETRLAIVAAIDAAIAAALGEEEP